MFQYSHLSRLDHTISEAWTTEQSMEYWTMVDSLGNRSRIAQVSINNPLNNKERIYSVMQRVRILDAYGITAFLGRIISIAPSFQDSKLILTCRDYLGELSDRVILAESGDGKYTAASRNGLLSKLVEEESEEPEVGQDMDRTLLPRMLQDTGNYLESITKTYSIRGMYGLNPSDRSASNYNYRGATTVLEALSQVSAEDAQQDLQVFYYTDTPVDPTSNAYLADSKRFPSTYWVDHTGGIADGTEVFSTPRHVVNAKSVYGTTTGTPNRESDFPSTVDATQQNDIMYFGSNSKFDGIEYTFRQSGGKIHESNYDELEWQYWDGKHWTRFVPDYDTKFKADSRETETVTGRAYWSSLINDTSMTNTVAGKNTPTAVSTQLDGNVIVNTVPFSIEDIVVDSSANLSVGGLIQVGENDTITETMRIISINGNTLTVYRNYPGTAGVLTNAHVDNSKVIGGHRQGMADWAKRDLAQSVDMHSYSDGNTSQGGDGAVTTGVHTDNARWRTWKNPYQSNSVFDHFRIPPSTAQLTTYDAPYPTGSPKPHGLRSGDQLRGTNFTGWEYASRSHLHADQTGYPYHVGARAYPHSAGRLDLAVQIPADRTDTMLIVSVMEFVKVNGIATTSFESGSGYARFGTYNPATQSMVSYAQMNTVGGYNSHHNNNNFIAWSQSYNSGADWTPAFTFSSIKSFYVMNPEPGEKVISVYPGSGGDGIGTYYGFNIMSSLFSGVDTGTAPTIATDYRAADYQYTIDGEEPSISLTTAPGDWVYNAWLYSKPRIGGASNQDSSFNSLSDDDMTYNQGSGQQSDGVTHQGLWNMESGIRHGTWSFRFGHKVASTTGTTTTSNLTVYNGGGTSLGTHKYKFNGHSIRIKNKYPGGAVGEAGFLNGLNYVEVLSPYTVNLWDHYKGANDGTDTFGNFDNSSNIFITYPLPLNNGAIDVTEKSGASDTETILEVGGSVRTDDVTSAAIPSMNIGEGRGTYKYWVRSFVRKSASYGYLNNTGGNSAGSLVVDVERHPHVNHTTIDNAIDFSDGQVVTVRGEDMLVTSVSGTAQLNVTRGYNGTTATAQVHGDAVNGTIPAQLATVSLYTAPETFRDFRAEDPKPFDEIWRYSSDIASTTLSSAVNNSTQSIPVTSAASFANDDVITIDSEDMLITGISSNTLSVTRGFNSGAEVAGDKAAHDDESIVSVSLYSENNHDMTGGLWRSLNTTGGNSGSGSILLWSNEANTAGTLFDNSQMLYLGSEEPFNGLELSAQQGKLIQITSITQANPAVITTSQEHGLTTGDYVVITGSNSGTTVDGYRQVTVISTTTFSVAVNNTAAGTLGSLITGIPDYGNVSMKFDVLDTFPRNYWGANTDGRIDNSTAWRTIQVQNANYNDISWAARSSVGYDGTWYPASPFGPTRWRFDGGHSTEGTINWYNEIRFNTDKPRNNQALKDTNLNPDRILPPVNPPRGLGAAEYDLAYQMSNSNTWSTRSSLIGPYSSHSMGTGARATHNNANTAQMYASTTAYVGSTTDIAMTFTTAHHCAVGDYIIFTNADGNDLDGVYRVKTVTDRYTFTFDCGRTGLSFSANDTLQMKRVSRPPNTKSLYWMRIRISGTPRTPMELRHVRTATNARFKYFDRGKEPWAANRTVSARGSAANEDLDAVYTYDASGGFASSNTTINAAMNSSQTTLTMANNVNIDPGMTIKVDSEEIFITDDGNPMNCVRGVNGTTAAAHSSGASVYQSSAFIYSSQASLGYTEFTTGYSTGYPIVHGLSVGDMVQITPNVYADTDSTSRTDSDHNDGIWKVERVPSTTTFVINKFFVSGWSSADKHLVHFTKFKDITPDVSSDSVDTQALTIASSGIGQPGTIRTDKAHEFRPNDVVIFAGTSSSPPTGNVYRVNEVVNSNEFKYRQEDGTFVNVTSALTDTGTVRSYTAIAACEAADAGRIFTENPHNLEEGQVITIVGTSISSLNTTTHVKEVLSPRIFTVNIDIASTGTANQGYITTDPVTIPSAVGDALYFGWHSPFTQLRIDSLTSVFADGGTGVGVWEYYRTGNKGESPSWDTLDVNDLSGGFKGYSADSDHEIDFFAPGFGMWKSCKAGVTDPSTQADGYQIQHLNKTFGNQYYFVRYRFTTAAASAISLSRVWGGPYVWNPDLETNTISGSDNKRHATNLLTYGINLDDREITQNEGSNVRVTSYELKDNAIDFVNVVTVRGIAGAYATARDEDSIRKFRVVKEKVIDDTSLVNDIQCMQRAKASLEQLGAKSPIDILDITAARPSVITTGGTYKYLTYTDNNNPMNVTFFENKGLEITGNSAENSGHTTALNGAINNSVESVTVDSTADFIVGHVILVGSEQMLITAIPSSTVLTVERNANGTTSTSHVDNLEVYIFNRTYITTENAHNLSTGDRVLITDVSNTAPRFHGIGAFSTDNPMSYNYVHKIVVTGQKQFYVQTSDSILTGTYALAHQMSVLNTAPDPDTTTALDNSLDAVGSIVHPMANTNLVVGDTVRLVATPHSAVNNVLSTVSRVSSEGSSVQLDGIGAGTTPTHTLGYAYIAEPHNLQTGDSIRINGTNSVPSIDGYRTIQKITDTTFAIAADLSGGHAGTDGVLLPTSIREATVKIDGFPVFLNGNGMPKVLRAGDLANVSLYNAGIVNESWMVYSIITGAVDGGVELTLFRDLSAVSEPGDAERQLLRDLSSHLRETANAVFQPIDKAVEKALDFLPEGPSRPSLRMEMSPTNLANSIDIPSPGLVAGTHTQTFPDDFRLSWKMYENFPTRETVDKDLLRIDMQGLRADDTGDASGGAGITFIGRDKVTGNTGSTPNFHPNDGEATLYLRDSDTAHEGRGLYLAHRGIFNSADIYDEWDTDTPKLQSEVFVGLSGRVTCSSGGTATITLPALTANPRIMATSESAGFVHISPFTISATVTTTVTLTVRDSGGTTINGAVINYIVVYNSSSNVGGLNSHY